MFIEINVTESPNNPLSVNRVFEAHGAPKMVSKVRTWDPNGRECLCDITGWASEGPCPAYAVLVEDSGEGIAMLIYGGNEGLRLKPEDCQEAWDVNSLRQWGEACLLLDKDVETR